jgi:hypothetical protein
MIMKKLFLYFTLFVLVCLTFISCDRIKQDSYNEGFKAGYIKGKEDYINELEAKQQEEMQKASRFSVDGAERDIKYYFELYKPSHTIIQSTLKIRKIEDYKFNIQLQSTEPDIFDSQRYNLHNFILTLSYNQITGKFTVTQEEGYSMVRKYR